MARIRGPHAQVVLNSLSLLIVVLFLVFGNKAPAQQDVPQVPITGLTDTSNQAASNGIRSHTLSRCSVNSS